MANEIEYRNYLLKELKSALFYANCNKLGVCKRQLETCIYIIDNHLT